MPRTPNIKSPQDYLDRVIRLIQRHALKSSEVNWAEIRTESFRMAEGAQTTWQTYGAIKYVLTELKDGHSFLVPGRASRGQVNNPEPTHRQTKKRLKPAKPALIKEVGYLPVPSVSAVKGRPALKHYAQEMRQTIVTFAEAGSRSWIFDLRGNGGGSMWPMLVGVGPVLGAGIVGFFESPGMSVPWYYGGGVSGIETASGRRKLCEVQDGLSDFGAEQPVAIIMDSMTASSAEAIAIAFKGRADTAYFGRRTAGLSTCNDELRLPDGAKIFLTVAVDADRNRNLYPAGLEPDFPVALPDQGSTDVVESAVSWLSDRRIRQAR